MIDIQEVRQALRTFLNKEREAGRLDRMQVVESWLLEQALPDALNELAAERARAEQPAKPCTECDREVGVVAWGPHLLCPGCAAIFMARMHARNQEALSEVGDERKAKVRWQVALDAERAKAGQLARRLNEANSVLVEVMTQACWQGDHYDTSCLSSYETGAEYLVGAGRFVKKDPNDHVMRIYLDAPEWSGWAGTGEVTDGDK